MGLISKRMEIVAIISGHKDLRQPREQKLHHMSSHVEQRRLTILAMACSSRSQCARYHDYHLIMYSTAKLRDYTPKFAYLRNVEERGSLLSGKKIELVSMVTGPVVEAEPPSQIFSKISSLQ